MKLCVSHSESAFRPKRVLKIIQNTKTKLVGIEFDSFAFTGMSGALIAPILAAELGKTLIMVRKSDENTHSLKLVEGDVGCKRYIIVDDFIEYGNTIRAIIDKIRQMNSAAPPECVGIVLYQHPATVNSWIKTLSLPVIKIGGTSRCA